MTETPWGRSGRWRHVVVLLPFLAGVTATLGAQSRLAEVAGTVSDSQGGMIAGATVAIVNQETGVTLETVTNETGLYRAGSLSPGTYSVRVSADGFTASEHSGLVLRAGQIGQLNATLAVGAVADAVRVTPARPLLQTESADVSQLVTRRDIEHLPNLSRKFTGLIRLSALTTQVSQQAWGHDQIAVAGNTNASAGFYLDGAQAGEPGGGQPVSGFHNEFAEEFRLMSNTFSAEFRGPQVVSVVTRSGSNELHGNVNLFVQDDALNARSWGATSKPPFREIDGGAQIGGPIIRGRTHFFVGYQYLKFESSNTAFLTVPTARQRMGDFSETFDADGELIEIYDPATTRPDPNNQSQVIRDQFPGNIIPPERLDSVGRGILNSYPAPNAAGAAAGAGNFVTDRLTEERRPQYIIRIDHNWSGSQRTFGSFVRTFTDEYHPSVYGVAGFHDDSISTGKAWKRDLTLRHTYVLRPSFLLETSLAVNNIKFTQSDDAVTLGLGWPERLGLDGLADPNFFPDTNISGYSNAGGGSQADFVMAPFGATNVAQRLSYLRGNHNLKAGFEFTNSYQHQNRRNSVLDFGPEPTMVPGIPAGTGNAAAAVLLGWPMSASLDEVFWKRNMNWLASYVEDTWKARDDLTVNLGLRVETSFPAYVRNRETDELILSSFDPDRINPVSGTPGALTFAGQSHPDGAFEPQTIWGPRLGFAWQPWGAGSGTVVRGGGGVFAGNVTGGGTYTFLTGCTCARQGAFVSPDGGITPPFVLSDGVPPAVTGTVNPVTGRVEPPGPGFGAVEVGESPGLAVSFSDYEAYRQWYSVQWNLTLERQLPWSSVLTASYLANLAERYPSYRSLNQIHPSQFGPGNAQIRRPFPQYTDVTNAMDSVFGSRYHAAQLTFTRRYADGVSFTADYVFNKHLSNADLWNAYDVSVWKIEEPRHRLVIYGVYDLPWGHGRRWPTSGWLASVLGGWVLAPNLTLQSGSYLDVPYFADTTNGFLQGNQGVNLVGEPNLPRDERSMDRWFNTEAFAEPAPFTLGNAGRRLVIGPGAIGFDLALSKELRFGGRIRSRISVELQNALNHPNLLNPGTTFGSPSFGVISGKSGNRRVQIGIRVLF